jgi:acid phosphatase family membrane protein YuiD
LYLLAPLVAWLTAGIMKYAINQIRFGNGRERIGNGGFPSNHTTIMTTTAMLIGFTEGFTSPVFGLGMAITAIVIFDATGLRRYVGEHAKQINIMSQSGKRFRESIGHRWTEVLGGLLLGTLLGYMLSMVG